MTFRPVRGACLVAVALVALATTGCWRVVEPKDAGPPVAETAPTLDALPTPAPPEVLEGWNDDRAFDALLVALEALRADGLTPEDYGLAQLDSVRADRSRRAALATRAWALAAIHLSNGKLDSETLAPRWGDDNGVADLFMELGHAQGQGDVGQRLMAHAPTRPAYLALRTRLAALLVAPDVAASPTPTPTPAPAATDAPTEETDGDAADEAPPAPALTRDAEIARLRVNLERLRWAPADPGAVRIEVNIPSYEARATRPGLEPQLFHVIVGQVGRKTPVFSDALEYMIFNPWWDVPDSIARNDKLTQFRRDPGAVRRLGYQVLDRSGKVLDPGAIDWASVSARSFPYRIRQKPGPNNALGKVKFIFPNAANVYMHDTPDQALFEHAARSFSSGCVRVQDPLRLAEWALAGEPGWDREAIEAAVATGETQRVDLATPIPVHIAYYTAVDDGCGGVAYLDDVYGRDENVLAALDTPPPEGPVAGPTPPG